MFDREFPAIGITTDAWEFWVVGLPKVARHFGKKDLYYDGPIWNYGFWFFEFQCNRPI